MTYFLSGRPLAPGERVALRGEEAHHAGAARRLRPGETLALQDPEGRRFRAVVEGRERGALWVNIEAPIAVPPLPPLRLTLIQAAVKAKAADQIVQKATELGVVRLLWFPAERSTVATKELSSARTGERWERIAWEACKQCDRQAPPQLAVLPDLETALAEAPDTPGWVLHEPGGRDAADALAAGIGDPPDAARLLIGPEGGLTDAEVVRAEAAGLLRVRLGGLVLRAETAATAACALMLHGLAVSPPNNE